MAFHLFVAGQRNEHFLSRGGISTFPPLQGEVLVRSLPFKGRDRVGMGSLVIDVRFPIPLPASPLKGDVNNLYVAREVM
jgi:hypothetical protein